MAQSDPSGIHERPPAPSGRSLERLLAQVTAADTVSKSELQMGDTVLVTTRNSTYRLCALGGDLYAVSGGWFDRHGPTPTRVMVSGCTWGGSALKHDIVASPGLFLEFGNGVKTTRIRGVRILRFADSPTRH